MIGRFQSGDLPERTFRFAEIIVDLVDQFPNNTKGWVLGKQLMKSGTSVGANVHEAAQAFTEPDFAYKCSIARKEASESHYWLRLSISRGLLRGPDAEAALQEADELTRILSTIVQKLQHRHLPQTAQRSESVLF